MTLKKKILLGLVCAVTVPVVTTSIIVYWQSRDSITSLAEQSLEAVKTNKATAVKDYFQTIQYQVQSLAENDAVVAATLSFKKSFNNYIKDNKFSEKDIEKQRTELSRYYEGDFSEQYAAKNRGENLNSQALWENLSARAVALQYQYIYKNSHPLGSKHLLDAAEGDQSAYAKTHRSVHPEIRNFLERFGYYDIFIADRDTGHIIYSVFKELDYATSLLDGPYKDTGIAQVFRKARNFSTKGQTTLTDYRSYLPSYRDPASFIASPIISNGETVAVLIFQMPIDRLNRIMSDRAGLGETGEAYLVGSDGLPRSNSFRDEQRSLSRAFRDPESSRIESESIREGISGNQGVQLGVNYEGQKVISAYVPVDVLNHRWVLMAEITQGEAFQSISELVTAIVIAALLLIGITLLVGSFLVTKLVQLITLSVDSLYHQTQNLEHSASSMKEETTKLSQNVLRSAAAVQENASSVSEINSTLSTNSALVDRVVDRSNEVLEQLSTADQQLETMNHSFNRIGEGVAKNNEIIKLVEEISTKTKMINEIVFKTQLLAVNASIEAARAGEQGRGFTVVAEEVTKLASVSGEAAEQIDRLIIHSREIITGLIKESQGVVGQSETNVQNFRSVFATVTQNIRQVLESTKDIASAIREQRQGVVQVTSAMEEIDRSVQANQQQAQQSQLLADGLHVTADKLGEIRDQFLSITMGQGLKRRSPSRALAAPISATHKNQQPSREVEEESLADDDSFTPAA